VRGRAERAAETLRIRVKTLVAGVLALGAPALLGRGLGGWRPLGVFDWQDVRGARGMSDDEVDRLRVLQQVRRKKLVLLELRNGAAGAFSAVLKSFSAVAASVRESAPVVAYAKTSSRRALTQKSRPTGKTATLLVRTVKRQPRSTGPAASHQQKRAHNVVTEPSQVSRSKPRSTPPPRLGRRVSSRSHNIIHPAKSATPSVVQTTRELGSIQTGTQKPSSSIPASPAHSPVRPNWDIGQRSLLGAGAGAVALGLSAAVGSGALTVALTVSAALVTASALVSPSQNAGTGPGSFILPPGFRRSAVVKRIEQSIKNATNGQTLEATPLVARKPLHAGAANMLPEAYLPETSTDFEVTPLPVRRLRHGRRTVINDGEAYVRKRSSNEFESLLTLQDGCGPLTVDSFSRSATIRISTNTGVADSLAGTDAAATEPVIEADAFQVLPTVPAIFSVPVVGAVLNVLDKLAYTLEQVVARVARRVAAAGLPCVGMLVRGSSDIESWELHRAFQDADV
jgi:hypothetical protein